MKTTYSPLAAPRALTPTKSAAAGPSTGPRGDDKPNTGGSQTSESLAQKLQNASITEGPTNSDSALEFEDLNPKVDLDSWDFVTDDDMASKSDTVFLTDSDYEENNADGDATTGKDKDLFSPD